MKRRTFVRLIALAAGLGATTPALFPRDALAAIAVKPRGDRAWLYGSPGGCAGTRRGRTGLFG